jgi:hypothetical protein
LNDSYRKITPVSRARIKHFTKEETAMKHLRQVLTVLACMCIVMLFFGKLLAQQKGAQQDQALEGPKVQSTEALGSSEVKQRLETLIRKERAVQALALDLERQGYKLTDGEKSTFGRREVYDVQGKQASFEFLIRDYSKVGSKDLAAVGTTKIEVDGRIVSYSFALLAPNGDFNRARENTTDKAGNVMRANSFLSCFRNRVSSKCSRPCITALAACAPTAFSWSLYFSCVTTACGACSIGAASCCSCNCKFYCKQVFSCCRQ